MLAYSLHAIHLKRDNKVVVQSPKEIFECVSEKQFNELKELGAVRDPTDAERALYTLANAGRVSASKPAPSPAPKQETNADRKKRADLEQAKAAAAADAQAADDAAALEAAAAVQAQAEAAAAAEPTIE